MLYTEDDLRSAYNQGYHDAIKVSKENTRHLINSLTRARKMRNSYRTALVKYCPEVGKRYKILHRHEWEA